MNGIMKKNLTCHFKADNSFFISAVAISLLAVIIFIYNTSQIFSAIETMNKSYIRTSSRSVIQHTVQILESAKSVATLNAQIINHYQSPNDFQRGFLKIMQEQAGLNNHYSMFTYADTKGNSFRIVNQGNGGLITQSAVRSDDDESTRMAIKDIHQALAEGRLSLSAAEAALSAWVKTETLAWDNAGKALKRTYFPGVIHDPREQEWYKQASMANSTGMIGPYCSTMEQEPHFFGKYGLTISVPVMQSGILQGVFAVDVPIDQVSNRIISNTETTEAFIIITDKNQGIIFASPELTKTPNSNNASHENQLGAEQLQLALSKSKLESYRLYLNGLYYYAMNTPFLENSGLLWQCTIMIPETVFAGPLRNNMFIMIILITILLALIIYQTIFNSMLMKNPKMSIDDLTGLMNRKYFLRSINKELLLGKQSERTFCICILDLDHFTALNSMYGKQLGDSLLIDFARFLKNQIGNKDVVARLQDDEFAILMINTNYAEAAQKIATLQKSFDSYKDGLLDHTLIMTSFTAGLSCYPEHADNDNDLMNCAEKSLREEIAHNKHRNMQALKAGAAHV